MIAMDPVPRLRQRHPRLGSALIVLVVATPPDARLVTPLGCAVEPLHAPEAVQSARIGGIGVVDDAILERERAHARPLARVRGDVGSAHGREDDGPLVATLRTLAPLPRRLAPVVVFDAPVALLLLSENRTLRSKLKSPPNEDAQGNVDPIPLVAVLTFPTRRPNAAT